MRIFNVNSGKVIESVVQTPDGQVTYEGAARIDGVPGSGAPIVMNFLDAAGAKTGKLLPTGNAVDVFDDVAVSCVDFTSPLVFVAASSLGKTGYESKRELDQDKDLLARLERIRGRAALRMGMGDVSGKVLPKIALLATPRHGGNISSRYFVPWNCHSAHAITGALCVAAACVIPDSVASMLVTFDTEDANRIVVEHPAGRLTTARRCAPGCGGAVADDQACGHRRHGQAAVLRCRLCPRNRLAEGGMTRMRANSASARTLWLPTGPWRWRRGHACCSSAYSDCAAAGKARPRRRMRPTVRVTVGSFNGNADERGVIRGWHRQSRHHGNAESGVDQSHQGQHVFRLERPARTYARLGQCQVEQQAIAAGLVDGHEVVGAEFGPGHAAPAGQRMIAAAPPRRRVRAGSAGIRSRAPACR